MHNRGGNYNPEGRRLEFGEKAKNYTIKMYSWEPPLVKEYLKKIREEKLEELKQK